VAGEVRVLGPVEVAGPSGLVELVGARQRALVGILALRVGALVPTAKLVEALWGENPPRTAVKTLHSHVARVRQALTACGLNGVLITREVGYELAMAPDEVDAARFERGVQAVRAELTNSINEESVARLRDHLALWRGEPFADAEVFGWAAAEVDRLREAKLTALEDVWEAELRLGGHRLAVDELDRLLVQHALRERLVGLSMRALYRCGRQTDALQNYQRLRARLADELGVDPSAELTELYAAILRNDPSLDPPTSSRMLAQLPARVGHFAGRVVELGALDALLTNDDPPLIVICGPAGMGKTALAVQWAHRIAALFPDGQLFLDLRGHDRAIALTATEALAYLLRSLGVPSDRVPTELDEQASLYRSLLYGKKLLLLLDNGHSSVDILPLVPGSSTCAVILTSRSPLPALAARHAVHAIHLEALTSGEALTLLTLVLGKDRVQRESEYADRLLALCGWMPLALRIAAAKLASDPRKSIKDLVIELDSTDRLDVLSVEGDSYSVRAVFTSVYRALSPQAARVFRLLGLHPGPTISTQLAAATCEIPLTAAANALEELRVAHLVTSSGSRRYRFHDLILLFARQCAAVDDRETALTRVLDWYLATAYQANRLLEPRRDRVVLPEYDELSDFADRHEALAFLDAERENLLPVVEYSTENGHHTTAWQLTYLLTSYFDIRGHGTERVEMCRLGVAAAGRTGDSRASGEMLRAFGVARHMTRQFEGALVAWRQALVYVRACDDRESEGHIFGNIANAYTELRRFTEAIAAYEQVLAMHEAQGNVIGTVLAQRNLGYAYVQMGQPDLSEDLLAKALAGAREIRNPWLEAGTLDTLGEASLHQSRYPEAIDYFRQAVAVSRDLGDRCAEATALSNIGAVLLRQDRPAQALGSLRQALLLARDLADRHIEARTLNLMGQAELDLGDTATAWQHLTLGLAVRTAVPDSYEEAHLHRNLGELEHRRGDIAASARRWDHAIRLYRKARANAEADDLAGRARTVSS
jgi:DNA-binding SARP family transcriptional activator